MIMIDPKMLELSVYEGIPHLLAPVVTDMKEAANALRWCVAEMERRYRLMAGLGVRQHGRLQPQGAEAIEAAEKRFPTRLVRACRNSTKTGGGSRRCHRCRNIVVIIDELADMMMMVGKKVEELIARLAQKARAAGIHMIIATQRPSVDVITGLIKANIPTRIAFQVSARVDSRTILDQMGAENLLGHGDMLYLPPGTSMPTRVHGAFVSDNGGAQGGQGHLKKHRARRRYIDEVLSGPSGDQAARVARMPVVTMSLDGEQDPLYDQAVRIVTETAQGVHLERSAAAEDRLQPRGADGRDHGGSRHCWKPLQRMEAAKSWRPRHRPTTDRLSTSGPFTIRLTISALVLLALAAVRCRACVFATVRSSRGR
jgi:DNA segregation ATPase FtsK/SpoIIIE, S-DNA-T family